MKQNFILILMLALNLKGYGQVQDTSIYFDFEVSPMIKIYSSLQEIFILS